MNTRIVGVVVLAVSSIPPPVGAQGLGTFRWQLQPFCNLITLSVQQEAGLYTLDGFDDQCGAAERGGVVGTAFLNPDGSIGLSLTMVGAGAAPAVLQARLDLATVSGAWSDSAGHAGAFVFTPGAAAPGSPRPVPLNGIRPASVTAAQLVPGAVGAAQIALGTITAAQLAPGAVGTAQIADGSITAAKLAPGAAQVPIAGSCPVGQYLRGVMTSGAVICEPFFVPTQSTTVDDPVNSVGGDTSIVIAADGLPVISHFDDTAGALRVTKCGNAACTAGNIGTTVDDSAINIVGQNTSIAIGVDGLPVISHRSSTLGGALRVTKCGNAACTMGNVSTTVDSPGNVGYHTSIAIGADGRPVISHTDATANALRVTKCGDGACTAVVSTTVDDQANSVGWFSSIAIGSDGLPVISHLDATAGALRVTKCGNPGCTAGNVSTTVDASVNIVGWHTSIAIGMDGLPVISHRDQSAGALRVTKCGNAACTAGNVSTTVDDPANAVGASTSIVIGADGLPVISHQDLTAWALRVTKCGNAACTAGNVSTTVDDPANIVGSFTAIAIGADGLPVISHQDSTAGALRVTKCGTQSCW